MMYKISLVVLFSHFSYVNLFLFIIPESLQIYYFLKEFEENYLQTTGNYISLPPILSDILSYFILLLSYISLPYIAKLFL